MVAQHKQAEFAQILERAAGNDPTLMSIDMERWVLSWQDFIAIMEAIRNNPYVTKINLSYNYLNPLIAIQNEGALDIDCVFLQENTALQELNLDHNKLGDYGFQRLICSLRQNPNTSLTVLRLVLNHILVKRSADVLRTVAQQNPAILNMVCIDLRGNMMARAFLNDDLFSERINNRKAHNRAIIPFLCVQSSIVPFYMTREKSGKMEEQKGEISLKRSKLPEDCLGIIKEFYGYQIEASPLKLR